MSKQQELIELYSNKSKHSNYQILPTALASIVGADSIQIKTRSEKERLDYILQYVDVKDKTVIDIGANTGYFSFELLENGAKNVHLVEGNKEHARFAELSAEVLGVQESVRVENKYFAFDETVRGHYDIGILLNVLHHIGDDYGDKDASIAHAKELMIRQLNSMSKVVDTLVFQLGFNWQGNPAKGLFADGTKQELIDFITEGSAGVWNIKHIAVAERSGDGVVYSELNDENIERDDSLGEFLNRPLFILEVK